MTHTLGDNYIAWIITLYAISVYAFYRIACWYWYVHKGNRDRPIYRMEGLIAWVSPVWPLVLVSWVLGLGRYRA